MSSNSTPTKEPNWSDLMRTMFMTTGNLGWGMNEDGDEDLCNQWWNLCRELDLQYRDSLKEAQQRRNTFRDMLNQGLGLSESGSYDHVSKALRRKESLNW